MSFIPEAVEALRRHRAWRLEGNRPWKCPHPTVADILDAELLKRGIISRRARDHWFCVWAYEVADRADPR